MENKQCNIFLNLVNFHYIWKAIPYLTYFYLKATIKFLFIGFYIFIFNASYSIAKISLKDQNILDKLKSFNESINFDPITWTKEGQLEKELETILTNNSISNKETKDYLGKLKRRILVLKKLYKCLNDKGIDSDKVFRDISAGTDINLSNVSIENCTRHDQENVMELNEAIRAPLSAAMVEQILNKINVLSLAKSMETLNKYGPKGKSTDANKLLNVLCIYSGTTDNCLNKKRQKFNTQLASETPKNSIRPDTVETIENLNTITQKLNNLYKQGDYENYAYEYFNMTKDLPGALLLYKPLSNTVGEMASLQNNNPNFEPHKTIKVMSLLDYENLISQTAIEASNRIISVAGISNREFSLSQMEKVFPKLAGDKLSELITLYPHIAGQILMENPEFAITTCEATANLFNNKEDQKRLTEKLKKISEAAGFPSQVASSVACIGSIMSVGLSLFIPPAAAALPYLGTACVATGAIAASVSATSIISNFREISDAQKQVDQITNALQLGHPSSSTSELASNRNEIRTKLSALAKSGVITLATSAGIGAAIRASGQVGVNVLNNNFSLFLQEANARILKKLKDNYGNDYHTFFSSLSTQSESLTKDVMNKIKEIGNESDMRIQLLMSKIKNRAKTCAIN